MPGKTTAARQAGCAVCSYFIQLAELQTTVSVQRGLRVGGFAADAQLVDQVVGRPGGAQRVAGGHTLPALHADSLQPVQVALYAAAVVDDHRAAGQGQRARKDNVACLRAVTVSPSAVA